jgi:glycosyltransferase involved in cell wall biosynthesis
MKIFFTTGIFPPDIGGPATYVPLMARALGERGHEVSVLTTSEPGDLGSDDSGFPFPVVRINRRLPLWRRTVAFTRAIVHHGREADVIYANGMHLEAALADMIVRKPLVMKIVGDEAWERATRKGWTQDNFEDFQQKRQKYPAELNKRLRAWTVRRADKVIIPSEYLKRYVTGWGVSQNRCRVIYNAVEFVNEIQPVEIPLETPVKLVTVGRLVPWKHVDKIIELLPGLQGAGLIVVGDGPERQRLESLVQSLNLTDRVYFAGHRSQKETYAFMSASDIFVLNSSYEGLPHVVVEAMRSGLSVVATSAGGTPEVITDGQTGILVSPGDTNALGEALKLLIGDAALRKRLAENTQTALDKFSYSMVVAKTEQTLLKARQTIEETET